MGEVPIRIPRDRESSFNPQIVKKHQRGVSRTFLHKVLDTPHFVIRISYLEGSVQEKGFTLER